MDKRWGGVCGKNVTEKHAPCRHYAASNRSFEKLAFVLCEWSIRRRMQTVARRVKNEQRVDEGTGAHKLAQLSGFVRAPVQQAQELGFMLPDGPEDDRVDITQPPCQRFAEPILIDFSLLTGHAPSKPSEGSQRQQHDQCKDENQFRFQ